MEDTEPIINVHNIYKTYNYIPIKRKEQGPGLWFANITRLKRSKETKIKALNNINFSVNKGEIFAIAGPNGAGKTTLMKLLSGLIYPTQGKGTVSDLDIVKDHDKLKQEISFVSASFWMGLEWQFTAVENVLQYATLMGVKNAEKKAGELIRFFEMGSFKDKKVPQLSAGMRQLVSIVRGFIIDRPIIYLDEPFVSLDIEKRMLLSSFLQAERDRGKTILISSHEFTDLDPFHPRTLLLNRGNVIGIGRAEDLVEEKDIEIYELSVDVFNERIEKKLLNKGIIAETVPEELIQLNKFFTVRLHVRNGMVNALIGEILCNNIHVFTMKKKGLSLKDAYLYKVKDEIYH